MDDCVKRSKAIKYIKDFLCRQCEDGIDNRCGGCSVYLALKLFEKVPAADVVDVVRCKDCKYKPYSVDGRQTGFSVHPPDNEAERCPCLCEDGWYSWVPDDEFYCGYGERRNNDG